MPGRRMLISHGDGAESDPELELQFDMTGDPAEATWTARTTRDQPTLPAPFAEGPVVVTLLEGSCVGARADARASVSADGTIIMLEGTSAFVAPT